MFNVSTEFRRNLYNDNRNYLLYADVVLADGTKLPLQNAQIWSNGYKIEDAVSGDNSFDIGSVIINKFTLTINNIYDEYSEYDFTGATVTARIGMEVSTGTEKIRRGVYTVDEPTYNGASITLECLDNLQNLDKPYSLSKLQFPATIRTIMQDACSCCGIQMATATFDNDSFVVDTRPDDESLTFRQVVFWCMQIACKWAKADEWGRLKVGWYDDVAYEGMRSLDGGSFDNGTPSYQSGDNFDGGTFADYNSGDSFDGGTFADQKKYHHIYSTSSTNLCTDDVVITGVRVICEEEQEVTDESGNTSTQKVDVVYQSGTDGYVLTVSGNKLIQNGKGNDVAVYLGQKLIGWRFRPFNLSCLSDPSIEAGDICIISDRKGNTYKSLVTNTTFQPGNYQAVSCGAESPLRNSATRFSEATQVYQELRKNLNRTKTEWEKAMENLSDRLENSGGLYTTIEKQEDGSSVFYMHDKPLMDDSLILWKMTRDAWGVSTDGGKTWNGGMTVDGEMIVRILQTIGLNADWINSGSIVIKDARNNVTFLADTATGEVRIVADSFVLRGKTIEELSQDANEQLINDVAADLQAQIEQPEAYLTQEKIFNKLTNNGALQGLYMSGGQLYINFSYARGGALTLGGNNNINGMLRLLNSSGSMIGEFSKDGIDVGTGGTIKSRANGHYVGGTDYFDRSSIDIKGGEVGFYNSRNNSSDTVIAALGVSYVPESGYPNSFQIYTTNHAIELVSWFKVYIDGTTEINGSLNVLGTKKRIIDTENYGTVSQYCYEMTSPMFGDVGEGETDDNGECVIFLDVIFEETVNAGVEYQVFLQKEGQGDIWVEEKNSAYFVARGTSNLKFAWEIKIKQRDYEYERMENHDKGEKQFSDISYEEEAADMVASYIADMEGMYNEEINELY